MKTTLYARLLFGASAVLFGVITLMWHDPETWQNLRHLWSLPGGTILGACLMIAQIAGGIALQYPPTVRTASVVLAIVYLAFALATVPDTIAATNVYDRYAGSFFVFFSMFVGAMAQYAATEPNAARATILGRVARLALGVCAISFTLGQALLLRDTAGLVPKWIPPGQMFWAIATTVAFATAAVAILINLQARLQARLMALMVGLFGLLVWVPLLIGRPKGHFYWSEFTLTLLVSGASWMVADSMRA